MDPAAYGTWNPELTSLEAEQAKLQNELKKKPPVVFAILAGVGFLLAVSFLRISLETYASPGDEALIARVGTVMLVLALLFLAAAVVFLILFIVKISKRKQLNKRLQEINRRLKSVPGTFGTY